MEMRSIQPCSRRRDRCFRVASSDRSDQKVRAICAIDRKRTRRVKASIKASEDSGFAKARSFCGLRYPCFSRGRKTMMGAYPKEAKCVISLRKSIGIVVRYRDSIPYILAYFEYLQRFGIG
jgi:hypothetical protein